MEHLAGRYRWNPQTSCRTLDGTAFVLLGNRMVTLNEVGTFIWERLAHGAALSELVSQVVEVFAIDERAAADDTTSFVERLLDERMVVPCP